MTAWFIGPLAGMGILGLAGLLLGLAARVLRKWMPLAPVWLASAGCGIAAVYAGAAAGWLHASGQSLASALTGGSAGIWFLAVFLCTLGVFKFAGQRIVQRFDAEGESFPRPLVIFLGLIVSVCAGGLVFYRWVHSGLWIARASAARAAASSRPNIVLITLDTVRADHLSSYGYQRPTTPNLDQWAQKGVLFENAIAPSSWTLASHATIFTGVLPHQHGANQATPLYPGPLPLAKILQSNGYETAGFSANLSYGFASWGMAQGFDNYEDDSVSVRHNLLKTKLGGHIIQPAYGKWINFDNFDRRDARDVNGDVFRWFGQRSEKPYFLFINYFDAHLAYFAPPPFQERFGKVDKASMRDVFFTESGRIPRPLSEKEQAALIAGYDNCLAFLDGEVGRLVRTLTSAPDGQNTIFIITSDHGEAFGEHGLYDHGYDLHREALHVPLIIFGPGIPSSLRVAPLVRIRQIFPTVLEMAMGSREPFNRVSLSRLWAPAYKPGLEDEWAISELVSPSPDFQPAMASLMTREWHYIHDSRGESRLYRWPLDPQEQMNLADSPEHQGTVRTLHENLLARLGRSYRPWRGPEYFLGLDGPGNSFAHESLLGFRALAGESPAARRIGTSQAFFTSDSNRPRRLPLMDEELIQSLPYH